MTHVRHRFLSIAAVATAGLTAADCDPGADRTFLDDLERLEVVPASHTLEPHGNVELDVAGVMASGARIQVEVSWSATGGTLTPLEPGKVRYTADSETGTYRVVATERHTRLADTATVTVVESPPVEAVLVGAGDIARCDLATDEAAAELLDALPDATIFTTGDNAYPDGTAENFAECYEPSWGRHKGRTRPSPGNHDYHTSGAAPYYAYFGSNAGPPGRGYYSYDLGAWHIISLNSEIDMHAGSAQEQWLRDDLAANPAACTLAYWHSPRFSSGEHGSDAGSEPVWDVLYDAGAEVIVTGHDHNYERFAPQTPNGVADPTRGIRQFVVGTGGTELRDIEEAIANSEVRNDDTHGVLKFTLLVDSYTWEFIPIEGGSFTDSGSGTCH